MERVGIGEVQTLFDAVPEARSPIRKLRSGAGGQNDAKRSIHYMVDAALEFGNVTGLDELLDRVAAFRQYKPYNALIALLQRPGATFVLPAHVWGEKYSRVILPNQQPLVMLQPGGPVMFLFDVSQTEEGKDSRPLPLQLRNPYGMKEIPEAASAVEWVIQNAKQDGVRVLETGRGWGFAGCLQRTNGAAAQRVVVGQRPLTEAAVEVQYDLMLNRSYRPTEQLATLAHELGHLYCGHLGTHVSQLWPGESFWADRSDLGHDDEELEAESVARLVFRSLAPGIELPKHLEQYFAVVPDLAGLDLERVLTAAGRVVEMADGHAPRRPRQRPRSTVPIRP
ncbi:MAG: ImmA/IrrE family metallo-endopeptidase [Cellulomonas sp.]